MGNHDSYSDSRSYDRYRGYYLGSGWTDVGDSPQGSSFARRQDVIQIVRKLRLDRVALLLISLDEALLKTTAR
jgi:hypothetical protein